MAPSARTNYLKVVKNNHKKSEFAIKVFQHRAGLG